VTRQEKTMDFVPFALVEWQAAHEEHTKFSLAVVLSV
jgi:hypothetical protein